MDLNYKDLDGVLKLLNYDHDKSESMDDLVIRLAKNKDFEFLKRISVIAEDYTSGHMKPLFMILERLDEDKLISVFNTDAKNTNEFTYAIKYRGIEFLSMGGYEEKIKQDIVKREKSVKENSLVKYGTYATILVGSYYVIQILKEFAPVLRHALYH